MRYEVVDNRGNILKTGTNRKELIKFARHTDVPCCVADYNGSIWFNNKAQIEFDNR